MSDTIESLRAALEEEREKNARLQGANEYLTTEAKARDEQSRKLVAENTRHEERWKAVAPLASAAVAFAAAQSRASDEQEHGRLCDAARMYGKRSKEERAGRAPASDNSANRQPRGRICEHDNIPPCPDCIPTQPPPPESKS